jgi:hypothetical protein
MSAADDPRQEKALHLHENGVAPVEVSPTTWTVISESDPSMTYVVEDMGGMWVCECADFAFRGGNCKHILLVKLSLKTCASCLCSRNPSAPYLYCKRERAHFQHTHTCNAYRPKLSKAEEVTQEV